MIFVLQGENNHIQDQQTNSIYLNGLVFNMVACGMIKCQSKIEVFHCKRRHFRRLARKIARTERTKCFKTKVYPHLNYTH